MRIIERSAGPWTILRVLVRKGGYLFLKYGPAGSSSRFRACLGPYAPVETYAVGTRGIPCRRRQTRLAQTYPTT